MYRANTVFLANKLDAKLFNGHDNLHEQLPVHLKMALK
jgi:hypothetical protein